MACCFKTPLLAACLLAGASLRAQDNYEIQVYGSETVAKGKTMVETHTNFTISGARTIENGVYPTFHAWHETLEVTHGFTSWFEVGAYAFTAAGPSFPWQFVGTHIRPRVRAPEEWHWPVGVSLSLETGYARRQFSEDPWSLEVRPIVDKEIGPWYLCFNPALDRAFHGRNVGRGVVFSPNAKVSYTIRKKVALGLEYYGSAGPLGSFDPLREQQQQFLPSLDLNLGEDWEFNFGVGVGVTQGTDHLLMKMIIGRRFNFPGRSK